MRIINNHYLKIKDTLVNHDKKIVAIIQFGSSIYARRYANDIDLLIITKNNKPYESYLECLDELDLPFNIDIIVKNNEKELSNELATQVLAFHKVIYGDEKILFKIMKNNNQKNNELIAARLENAKVIFEMALNTQDEARKDDLFRTAFNILFHAALLAASNYLATENKRWGKVKKKLPQPYKNQLEKFVRILHVKYFYHGKYNKEKVEEVFKKYKEKVEEFIKNLRKD